MYNYKNKLITVEEAVRFVKSGDDIVTGLGPAVAHGFMSKLHTVAEKVSGVTVNVSLCLNSYDFFADPKYSNSFMAESWFLTPPLRAAMKNGSVSYMPCHLQYCAIKRLKYKPVAIYVGTASMPDEEGYVTLSLSDSHEMRMLKEAAIKILEINPNYPGRIRGSQSTS